jgi:uncharacterized membrane protein SirB2
MSHQFYNVLHLIMVMLFALTAGSALFDQEGKKWPKIVQGIASLMILVGGMGLLARLGFAHGSAWPSWVMVKIVLWAFLAIGSPILIKRLKAQKFGVIAYMFIIMTVAAILGVTKPMWW